MSAVRRRPLLTLTLLVAVIFLILVSGFGYYLADSAGQLPWQEDPTRIAITPFADIPGFGAAATATTGP